MSFELGQRVETEKNGKGKVAFVGTTKFAEGEWIGVILDEPKGKNNGSVNKEAYFVCEQNFGLFIRPTQLKVESSRVKPPPSSGLKTPSANLRKDSVHGSSSKLSTGSSPAMSPAASRENLSRMPQSVGKKSIGGVSTPSLKVGQKGSDSRMNSEVGVEKEKLESNPSSSSTDPSNVLSRVKKMEEDGPVVSPTQPSAPVIVPEGMDQGTEIEYLLVQVKERDEKLETLRLKRKEDKDKLVEYERMKIQMHGLAEYKNKAHDANMELERKLREKEQELDGLREWKESKSEELRNSHDEMEMLTLDKEMAEEKAELLQVEVDELKTKVEELEVNMAIMREEMENGGGGNGEGNSVQMKQIISQNERLREALIKLRDANGNAMEEKTNAEKELERLRNENGELLRMGELWKRKAEESEEAIMNLKEQVDAYLASEEVIQHLTDKNLDMEEKIRVLELDKEDLEVMRDMDEQIAEEQKEVEKALRTEIEAMQVSINELLLRQRQDEEHSEQLSETIIKFRKKTADLNGEMEDLKDQILHLEKEVSEEREGEKDRAGQASLALINAARQFSIMVEWRTRGVEVQYGEKHVKYLKAFLPDNFTKAGGDNDCVSVSLIVPRLGEKALLLSQLLKEKYPQVPGGMRMEHVTKSHKGEQWAQVGKAAHLCAAIYRVCGQIESGLSTCTVDRLSSIAHLNADFTLQERHIDNYMDLLKNGRMDENSSLDYLESCYRYLSKRIMEDQLAGRDSFDALTWISRSCLSLLSSIEWIQVNENRLAFLVTSETSDVMEWMKSVGEKMKEVDQLTRKINSRLPKEGTLILTESLFDNLTGSLLMMERVCGVIHDTCALAATQLSLLSGESTGFSSTRVKEMIHNVVEKTYGKTSLEKVFQHIDKDLSILLSSIETVHKSVDDGSLDVINKQDNKYPPVIERAHSRKQAAAEAEGLRWQLEKKENEAVELKKMIKARTEDVSNYKLRLEMADARLEQFSKVDSQRESHLQTRIDELSMEMKKQRNDYEETLDALHKDLRNAEGENSELKERAKNMSKKALLQGIQSMEKDMGASSPGRSSNISVRNERGASTAETAILQNQLEETLNTLKRTTLEMRKAKAACAVLAPLAVSQSVCGPYSLNESVKRKDSQLEAIEWEASQLSREESRFAFFTPNATKSWRENEELREEWNKDRETFLFRVQCCRNRLHEYWTRNHPGVDIPQLIRVEKKKTIFTESELNINSSTFKHICSKWGIATA